MTWTNWNAIATALADYAREVARSAAPGTATIQFPADGSRVLGVFGSVGSAADEKAGGRVEQLRRQLREAGVRELGFGLSKDGHTWAVVIEEEDNVLATCLDQAARERGHATSPVPADVPDGTTAPSSTSCIGLSAGAGKGRRFASSESDVRSREVRPCLAPEPSHDHRL